MTELGCNLTRAFHFDHGVQLSSSGQVSIQGMRQFASIVYVFVNYAAGSELISNKRQLPGRPIYWANLEKGLVAPLCLRHTSSEGCCSGVDNVVTFRKNVMPTTVSVPRIEMFGYIGRYNDASAAGELKYNTIFWNAHASGSRQTSTSAMLLKEGAGSINSKQVRAWVEQ